MDRPFWKSWPAKIIDFKLVRDAENNDIAYKFRIGHTELWDVTFQEFKQRIPSAERKPEPDKGWNWTVDASPQNKAILSDIFMNFESEYQAAASQLKLF